MRYKLKKLISIALAVALLWQGPAYSGACYKTCALRTAAFDERHDPVWGAAPHQPEDSSHRKVDVSVIIPAHNEKDTLEQVVDRVNGVFKDENVVRVSRGQRAVTYEIIVVDDGSTDGTGEIGRRLYDRRKIQKHIFHMKNQGKGGAFISGLKAANSEVTVVQDADLEYSPEDIPAVIGPILENECDVCYGDRQLYRGLTGLSPMLIGERFVSLLTNVLFSKRPFLKEISSPLVEDVTTCYKATRTGFLKDLLDNGLLKEKGFNFDLEITIGLLMGLDSGRIRNVKLSVYKPRGREEGKHLKPGHIFRWIRFALAEFYRRKIRTSEYSGLALDKPEPKAPASIAAPYDEPTCRRLNERIILELGLQYELSRDMMDPTDKEGPEDISTPVLTYGSREYTWEKWSRTPKKYALKYMKVLAIHNYCFLRIGHLFFIDDDEYRKLSPGLKNAIGANAIRIKDFKTSTLNNVRHWRYTMSAIIAMLNSDITGKYVIDAGAGDGMLSLVAARLGARSVHLVEFKEEKLNQARTNLELNGIGNYSLLNEDLRNTEEIARKIQTDGEETAIVSNIGTWMGLYDVTNQDSMQLMRFVPNVTLFIAGGYTAPSIFSRDDRDHLEELGFSVSSDRAEYTEDGLKAHKSAPTRGVGGSSQPDKSIIAWTASRKIDEAPKGLPPKPKDIPVYARCGNEIVRGEFKEFTQEDLKAMHWENSTGRELSQLGQFRSSSLKHFVEHNKGDSHRRMYCIKSNFRGRPEIELLLSVFISKDTVTINDLEIAPFNKDVLQVNLKGGSFTIRYRKSEDTSSYRGLVTSVDGFSESIIGRNPGVIKRTEEDQVFFNNPDEIFELFGDVPEIIDADEIANDGVFGEEGRAYDKARGFGKAAVATIMNMHRDKDVTIDDIILSSASFYQYLGFEWDDQDAGEGSMIAGVESDLRRTAVSEILAEQAAMSRDTDVSESKAQTFPNPKRDCRAPLTRGSQRRLSLEQI
ncbi:MAG: glycosyltransferase [Candidatus Omnitrophota bacterium]